MSYYSNDCCQENYSPCNPCYDPCNPCNQGANYVNYPILMKCVKRKKQKKHCPSSNNSSCSDSETFNESCTDTKDCNITEHQVKCIVKKKLKPLKRKLEPIWDAVKTNYILKCSRSMAFGYCNTVGGCSNLTVGSKNSACGYNSLVVGSNNSGYGQNNVILGTNVTTNNYSNVFAFSDASGLTGAQINLSSAAYFGVANGMTVYTNAARTVGVSVPAGGNSWAAVCDKNLKRDMVEIDGYKTLQGLSELKYYNFKYRDQDLDDEQEFIAPTAQDFNRVFPLHKSNEKVISQFDATCITMASVSELYKRYIKLENELDTLKRQLVSI